MVCTETYVAQLSSLDCLGQGGGSPRLPAPLRRRAKAVAALRGETISDVVRDALEAYIGEATEEAEPSGSPRASSVKWASKAGDQAA